MAKTEQLYSGRRPKTHRGRSSTGTTKALIMVNNSYRDCTKIESKSRTGRPKETIGTWWYVYQEKIVFKGSPHCTCWNYQLPQKFQPAPLEKNPSISTVFKSRIAAPQESLLLTNIHQARRLHFAKMTQKLVCWQEGNRSRGHMNVIVNSIKKKKLTCYPNVADLLYTLYFRVFITNFYVWKNFRYDVEFLCKRSNFQTHTDSTSKKQIAADFVELVCEQSLIDI